METKFQTSFIPKNPAIPSQTVVMGRQTSVVRSSGLLNLIAGLIFAMIILVALGLFGYKIVLNRQIEQAGADIDAASTAFQPDKIRQIIDENARMIAAKNLLDKHVATSKIFLLLQNLTVKKMRFSDFDFTNKDGQVLLKMKGESQTYNALAEQGDIFSKNDFIKSPEFSNFTLKDNGYITFDFSATIDPDLISYKKALDALPTGQ